MGKTLDKTLFCLQIFFCLFLCLGLRQRAEKIAIQKVTEEQVLDFFSRPLPQGERKVVSMSETPIKYADVAEGDFIQHDERYIYYLCFDELRVINAKTYEVRNFSYDEFYPLEMIQTEKVLLLLGVRISTINIEIKPGSNLGYELANLEIKIINKTDFRLLREITFNDSYFRGIRVINNEVFIIANNSNIFCAESHKFIYPRHMDSLFGEGRLTEDNLYLHPESNNIANIILIYSFKLNANERVQVQGLIGVDGALAVNREYVILTSSLYKKESYILVHLFNIERKIFTKSLILEGYLTNYCALDTYNGYLRVGVTRYTDDEVMNILFNAEISQMKISSSVAYGKMESVYAIKFFENQCYITTYLYYSPLIFIDLTDPRKVVVKDRINVDFISEYLDVRNNAILSIGRRVDDYGNVRGLVLANFEQKNLNEKNKYMIVENDIDSEICYDYRALCRYDDYILFPINNNGDYSVMVFRFADKITLLCRLSFLEERIHRIIIINDLCYLFGEKAIFIESLMEFRPLNVITL